jgi:hypothetical protein
VLNLLEVAFGACAERVAQHATSPAWGVMRPSIRRSRVVLPRAGAAHDGQHFTLLDREVQVAGGPRCRRATVCRAP